MNRATRRKLTTQDLNNVKSYVIKKTIHAIYLSVAMKLSDKYNWNKEDIGDLLNQVDATFEAIDKGYLTLEDIK